MTFQATFNTYVFRAWLSDKVGISGLHLPDGVIGANFSVSSCVGDTLLLLLLLWGDDNVDTAFPCESTVRMELSVVAVARGAPQKFKSNLLPVKRTSRSRRASRSLSKCNCKKMEKNIHLDESQTNQSQWQLIKIQQKKVMRFLCVKHLKFSLNETKFRLHLRFHTQTAFAILLSSQSFSLSTSSSSSFKQFDINKFISIQFNCNL